jgi:hypothetical protein
VTPQGNYQESEVCVKLLLRRPGLYLIPHWIVTLTLAAVLLVPHGTPAPAAHSITLLTGQVVGLNAGGSPQPAPGLVETSADVDGRIDPLAYPIAAAAAIGPFLDPHLFDVGYLEREGYDDQARSDIPVIVAFASHDLAVQAVRQGTIEGGIHLTHAFEYGPFAMGYISKHGPFVPATVGDYSADGSMRLGAGSSPDTDYGSQDQAGGGDPIGGEIGSHWSVPATSTAGVTGIFLDAAVHESPDVQEVAPLLDSALPLIGAPAARARGLTGKGVKIAVVDTGIDATHPDLQGRVIAAKDFGSDGNPADLNGHGTHVSGIAAGTGAASDGKYGGVAPQAELINAKALSRYGSGTESGIMKAMDWAADQGARIVNMSLGGPPSDGTDPMSREVNSISEKKNVLFVIAAGNGGPARKVSTPAAADMSLAVGAVDKTAALAPFSSRGPRLNDMALKPDIVAPGVQITAPRANPGSGNPYATYSGTSMAAPMVAGSAALVMQLHPSWSAAQVKQALMSAAAPLGPNDQTTLDGYVSPFDQGSGLVDLKAIADQVAYTEPASLSFKLIGTGERRDLSLTIHNISPSRLLLHLRGVLHGPEGAISDGLELSTTQLEVPPEGAATLRVIVQGPPTAGQYSGEVLFVDQASGKQVARDTVGFVVKGN